jgi:hypothetical protein
VSAIKIDARIDNHVATVKVEHLFRNDTDQQLEGTYYFPVPEGATLIEFAFYNADERCVGRAMEKEEARASSAEAAILTADPAILEMTRRGWFQSRVYPIPPRSEKRVEIVYSYIISADGDVYTFDYELGQAYKSLRVPVGEIQIRIDLGSDAAIEKVFSPTHPVDLSFDSYCHVSGKLAIAGGGDSGRFKLVYTLARDVKERGTAQGESHNIAGNAPGREPRTHAEITQHQMNQELSRGRRSDRLQMLAQAAPGTVVDPTGAVISGATVTIKDQNTGAIRTVTTDSSGSYSVAGLPPGKYNIEVDAPGFKKTQIENVVVQPGQASTAGVHLSPGAVAETVTIMSVATAVDSSASHVSSNYESRELRDLPSLAPVESFARLAPGMTSREANELNKQTGTGDKNSEFRFWFNGGRPRSNNFSLDGQDNNDIDGRPTISINNFDSADSLHIVTARSAGDVGLTGASSINLLTRAGTNEYHGTLFDYHLNRRFGALSPLERRSGLDRAPEFKNTIYGGTIGGPLKRDRAFFFGAFQGESEGSLHFIDSTASQLTPTLSGLDELARIFPSSAAVSDLITRGPLARTTGNPQAAHTFFMPIEASP